MTRARDLSNDEANGGGATPPFVAGKNKLINGDFSIWQRGTSFSSSGYTSDRWKWAGGTGTISRQAFTLGATPTGGYESPFYLNWTITGNSQNYELQQNIEDVRTLAGQVFTLSFWARSTVGAQPQNAAVYQYFGTGGSPSSMVNAGITTYTPTAVWQRFSFTYTMPSISGKTLGTNGDHYIWVRVAQMTTTATNTSLDIWGVQLEAGSVATPFTEAGGGFPGAELALCQRYYYRNTPGTGYGIVATGGVCFSTTTALFGVQFPVTMRIYPTSADFSNLQLFDSGNTQYSLSAVTVSALNSGTSISGFEITASGLTVGRPCILRQNNNVAGYLGFSAEL